jgi:hypothetical protein
MVGTPDGWLPVGAGFAPPFRHRRRGRTTKGNPALRSALCEAAWAASHGKDGYLVAHYRRFQRRFGKNQQNKVAIAVAHTLLVIVWHILRNGTTYEDLVGDYFAQRHDATARKRYLVGELEKPQISTCPLDS